METNDLRNWQVKHVQTDNSLKAEERRLESVSRELRNEQAKYQRVKESFQKTRERLLSMRETEGSPERRLRDAESASRRLINEKKGLEGISSRLESIEDRVREQSVLVMQNKKKLEILEGKISELMLKRNSKATIREELEILDAKILQLVSKKVQLKAECRSEAAISERVTSTEREESEKDTLSVSAADNVTGFVSTENVLQPDTGLPERHNNEQDYQSSQHGQHAESSQPHADPAASAEGPQNAASGQQDFYRKAQEIEKLSSNGQDSLSLNYTNSKGHVFELEIRKQSNQGLIVDIRAHSKIDSRILSASRHEIIASLRAQGLVLNKVYIREGAKSDVYK